MQRVRLKREKCEALKIHRKSAHFWGRHAFAVSIFLYIICLSRSSKALRVVRWRVKAECGCNADEGEKGRTPFPITDIEVPRRVDNHDSALEAALWRTRWNHRIESQYKQKNNSTKENKCAKKLGNILSGELPRSLVGSEKNSCLCAQFSTRVFQKKCQVCICQSIANFVSKSGARI